MAASKRLAEDILEGEEQDCKVVVGQRGIAQDNRWEALFRNCHILHEFEHFLIVIASAKTSRNQGGNSIDILELSLYLSQIMFGLLAHV